MCTGLGEAGHQTQTRQCQNYYKDQLCASPCTADNDTNISYDDNGVESESKEIDCTCPTGKGCKYFQCNNHFAKLSCMDLI